MWLVAVSTAATMHTRPCRRSLPPEMIVCKRCNFSSHGLLDLLPFSFSVYVVLPMLHHAPGLPVCWRMYYIKASHHPTCNSLLCLLGLSSFSLTVVWCDYGVVRARAIFACPAMQLWGCCNASVVGIHAVSPHVTSGHLFMIAASFQAVLDCNTVGMW